MGGVGAADGAASDVDSSVEEGTRGFAVLPRAPPPGLVAPGSQGMSLVVTQGSASARQGRGAGMASQEAS
jgi:hypothetical protein